MQVSQHQVRLFIDNLNKMFETTKIDKKFKVRFEAFTWDESHVSGLVLNMKKLYYISNDVKALDINSHINIYLARNKKNNLYDIISIILHELSHIIENENLNKKESETKAWIMAYYLSQHIPILDNKVFKKRFNFIMKKSLISYKIKKSLINNVHKELINQFQ